MTNATSRDTSYDTALAIIGMSGRFPGASNIEEFWQNVAGGIKSIRFFTDEELLAADIDPAFLRQPNYVKAGGVLEKVDYFDASFFGYTRREAELLDPQHRLFMECAWEALEDAAYYPQDYPGLIGIFAGCGFSTYLANNLYYNAPLKELVSQFQIDIGNEHDSLVSAISYRFNLKGPSVAVQTFCSTSLVAVHSACQSLFTYECDLALAGGVAITVPQRTGYSYEEGGILSPDGECRTFDARAQGSVMGDGLGVVVLKRFSEAVEDGDHIYAVIRGSAINSSGSMRVSYTAPGLHGQKEVIAEALGHADVSAETINYIEAHGTATPMGDAVELAAMIKAFEAQTQKKQFCAIGSVKPNVGHLDRASGVTGLIKTTMALTHRQLPPSVNFERAHPDIGLENSPFFVNTVLREWSANQDGTPRRAGVSSFGLGGVNAHVVLEEAPLQEVSEAPCPSCSSRPWQLLLFSAKTETALQASGQRLAAHLRKHEELALADIAYTLQVGRGVFNYRRAVICQNREEAIEALAAVDDPAGLTGFQTYQNRSVVFLLSDAGEVPLVQVRELYYAEPVFRETLDSYAALLKDYLHMDLFAELLSAGQSSFSESIERVLSRSAQTRQSCYEKAVPARTSQLLLPGIEYALVQLLISWGLHPRALLARGHSEFLAACLAGVFSLEDALLLLTGSVQQLQEVHSTLHLNEPEIPFFSNVTGQWITAEQATDLHYWLQLKEPGQPGALIERFEAVLREIEDVLLMVGVDQSFINHISMLSASEREPVQQDLLLAWQLAGEERSPQAHLLTTLSRLWLAG
ncbi:MAG TPA: type I polyketide synthase, partial [Ktedonobacteraceae bacterium]|nr:type I polyketide synthase [Ktedonobacteraceae bacterium]